MQHRIRLGTRASALARWQAEWVADRLRQWGVSVELVLLTTKGDQDVRGPLASLGGEGLFTKELQHALLADNIDLAVHSLKDLPTESVAGLCLAAVPQRGPIGDALISRDGPQLSELPQAATVGTGSIRRRAQLWHARPDLKMQDIRGNVDTRLRKLDEGQYDAIVLAEAGLQRLGLEARITQRLAPPLLFPAVGQGALGLEIREFDQATRSAVQALDDPTTHAAVTAERALLATLCAGCLAPVGAWGRSSEGRLQLEAVVLSHDGQQKLSATGSGEMEHPEELGRALAQRLLDQGAEELIQRTKDEEEGRRTKDE